jgi:hypothetical protein
VTALSVPDISPDDDTLGAALKYAACGWYLLPVKAGTKRPGSVVGDAWQHQSSRDPHVLAGWFAGTDYGLALHMGRSGAVAADVDDPDALPDALRRATSNGAPFQSTRADQPGRGHYLFTQPPGRNIGNSSGSLGKAWGEIRGKNGVIIVAPSVHQLAADGGRYQWVRTGPVPVLPEEVAAALPEAAGAADAATDAEVEAFLDAHTTGSRPELLDVWWRQFAKDVDEGASRHTSMVSKLAGAMKEAAAGLLDARTAADTLESMFLAAVSREGTRAAPCSYLRAGVLLSVRGVGSGNMADLYTSMWIGTNDLCGFPDEGNGDLYEARKGGPGAVEVWVHRRDGTAGLYEVVSNSSVESVRGEK